jgi:NADH-quinone oxidoreductase subunit J
MAEILVYIFSFSAILSGFLVISSTNPVHSVFSLVMCFVNTSILLLLLGFEFLALLFLIVYVGALAILFLFVVMMLNVRLVELIENSTRYLPIGSILGIVFMLELFIIVKEQYTSEIGSVTNKISQE